MSESQRQFWRWDSDTTDERAAGDVPGCAQASGSRTRRSLAGVVDRRALGSWLHGPRAAAEASGVDFGYPGERLGLPERGPRSVARFGARLGAFALDALMCNLVALGLAQVGGLDAERGTVVFWVFAVEVFMLSVLGGASAGQRLVGMQIVRLDGRAVGLGTALVRTVLLLLLVPALIWDRDQRGLHDKAARTVLIRTR